MKSKLLEAVVKEMQAGVVVIDEHRQVLYSNPFFDKTFSMDNSQEGRRFADIISDTALLDTVDEVFSSDRSQSQEITIQGKGNQILEARLVPFDINIGAKVLVGFFKDVTEEKRVEAIKRDFVANVSHELRTPLASIKGYAETLLDGALDDKGTLKNFLTIIDRHANRMTALIEDLLTLSRLESHQIPMDFESLDITVLIDSVVHGFEKQAKDKGVELSVNICGEVPAVKADRWRIEQVIVNLVDNAIKYTNKGAVKISAGAAGDMLRVEVEDTGIGIPEKDIPRIFERFYRVDKGRSRELGGTGLGLAIVKHIIQGHNGKIWVKSQHGKGSTFSFEIPLRKDTKG